MQTPQNVRWADVMAPLTQNFGDRLAIFRERDRVMWTLDEQSVVVDIRAPHTIGAIFVDRPATDAVSSLLAAGIYHASGADYQLTAEGATRLVDDMVAFFSGVREPRFAFVTAHILEAA
jgi:hypothetical protein